MMSTYKLETAKMQKTAPHLVTTHHSHSINLSDRECEVLKLIVEGQTNQQIASQLYLSINTVKAHVRSIFNKMGINHRVQAAVMALRHELI
jgi:DNA-binding NarL/FixJ family response regulator